MRSFLLVIAFFAISVISFSQNVGIGTTTPAAKLDVKAASSYVGQFNGLAPMYLGIFENDLYRGYWGSYSGNAEDVDFGTGSGTTGKLHLTIQANPKLTINNVGQVGIGTTNPAYLMHVNGGDLFVESSSGKIIFGYNVGGSQWRLASTVGGADMRWYSYDGVTETARHYFQQNGNVGIATGITTPIARLEVLGAGATSATNNLVLRASTGDTLLRMRDDGRMGIGYNGASFGRTMNLGGSGINFYTANEVGFGGAAFPTDTSLILWSNSAANNYLIFQPVWGNTGIGTYSPDAKLDVSGTTIIGINGTVLNAVIRSTQSIDIPNLAGQSETIIIVPIASVSTGATVYVSPDLALTGVVIGYARVSSAGNVEIKFSNPTVAAINPPAMNFHITVFQ